MKVGFTLNKREGGNLLVSLNFILYILVSKIKRILLEKQNKEKTQLQVSVISRVKHQAMRIIPSSS